MDTKKGFGKAARAALACALAVGLMPLPAFAGGLRAGDAGGGAAAPVSAQAAKAGGAKTAKKVNVSKCKVAKIKVQKYTGEIIKPNPKVTYRGKTLKKGRDYTLRYKNVSKKYNFYQHAEKKRYKGTASLWGDAQVVVTGKGRFTGVKAVKFKIKKPKVDKVNKDAFNNGRISWAADDPDAIYVGELPMVMLYDKDGQPCLPVKQTTSSIKKKTVIGRGKYEAYPWKAVAPLKLRAKMAGANRVELPKGLARAIIKQAGIPWTGVDGPNYITVWTRLLVESAESPTSCRDYYAARGIDVPLWLSKRLYKIDQWCLAQKNPFIGNYGGGGYSYVVK